MTRPVVIIDTSVMCCLLDIPGKQTCGPDHDKWDTDRAKEALKKAGEEGATLVLPLATLIETGNHIAQAPQLRYELATDFAQYVRLAADGQSPWAAFTDQADLWGQDQLRQLAATWPALAAGNTSIGDATIKDVAEYYAKGGFKVEILTGDAGLKAYQPISPPPIPRRRS